MKLLVIDNLMIVPSMDVYIMINTAVKYRVKRFRQNSVIGRKYLEYKYHKYCTPNLQEMSGHC